MLVSQTCFERHEHSKPVKRKIELLEDFDPRPVEFRGSAKSNLPKLLTEVEGKKLCISLLLDPIYCEERATNLQPDAYSIPSVSNLKSTIQEFKKSLEVSQDEARKIERDTRDQRMSSTWFNVRRYRLTASNFGAVISRKPDTPPDKLVLQILRPTNFTSPAIQYGIQHEKLAVDAYVDYQQHNGHPDILVTQSGFIVNPLYPFLGASPDGTVYDPSNEEDPFGFVEVKCPYSARDITPSAAAAESSFYCKLDSSGYVKLKHTHHYYAQVQGQMAIGDRPWCDFVIYTSKGISIERINFDRKYWEENLQKLVTFYDNCIAPEAVSPLHSVDCKIRKLL